MLQLMKAAEHDEPFLYELFAETRQEELRVLNWDDDQKNMFLRMQFNAQKRSYRAQYPGLKQSIVYQGENRVGQMTWAVTASSVVLVDVTLSPPYRNQGIGTRLIEGLMEEARQQDKSLRLHVLQHNPALRLYGRLGFRITGEPIPYLAMEWNESYTIDSPDNLHQGRGGDI